MIRSLDEIIAEAKKKETYRIAVAAAQDVPVLLAVARAKEENIAEPVLVGDKDEILKISIDLGLDFGDTEIIDIEDKTEACMKAAHLVSEGRADLIMKGFVDTAVIMRAVLDPQNDLLRDRLVSHVAVLQVPAYERLFYITDSAMNIAPDLEQKQDIIINAVEVAHALHNERPNVGILAAVEKVNPKMECTVHAKELTDRCRKGAITGCSVYGPLALDNAVSEEAAKHKGIKSSVAGNADILLAPDIEAGNILNKSMEYFAGGLKASIIVGAKVPVVLTSRASSAQSKLYSIALGVLVASYEGE